MPITQAKLPSEFPGNDEEYLREVKRHLEARDVPASLDDPTLAKYGRQFCAILSGGGMVADKVDFWGGMVRLTNGMDIAIFVSAWDVYCPSLAEGYKRIREGSMTAKPTAGQSADLARFVVTLHQHNAVPYMEAMSTPELQRTAAALCTTTTDPQWPAMPKVVRVATRLPLEAQMRLFIGLALGFCPRIATRLYAELEEAGITLCGGAVASSYTGKLPTKVLGQGCPGSSDSSGWA